MLEQRSGRRAPDVATRTRSRTVGLLLAFHLALGLLAVATLLSVGIGSAMLPLDVVWRAFTEPDGSVSQITVTSARVDRTLLAIVTGLALGVAGALIQALTRNPLADPGILGVNAGAGFAVVLAVALLGVTSIEQYLPFAFLGAFAASVIVYLVASGGRGVPTPLRLTLVGVALGAVLTGVTQTLALIDVNTFDRMRFWGAGTVADRPAGTLAAILPFIVIGLLLAVVSARRLNVLALGEDLATSLGAKAALTRPVVVVAVTLLCGAATAAVGPIVFVGLMVPHAVRWLTGPDWRWILAFSAVLAPVLMLVSDVVGRLIVLPAELQVGIVTALIGAPILILLVRRQEVSGL
ncbi:MAG TPA: iron chelate uptake ABC transporter family permease subunit [Plantibacter sp.]|uniref:iron chelate uptake ABC transporter family permease subunit n=1 Tax=unclassified Plantibacter TaxID=2624265 RepID=UPI002CAAA111|nr:iron chelate uptake ABC transporter family permease subunit [Plantibacter sp.]